MREQPILKPLPLDNLYELMEDYEINILSHKIVVPKSFKYDGASIPAAAWQMTYSPFDPDVMLPALVHDWLFFNHQMDQVTTDEIFYLMLKENGVNNAKATMMWAAVSTVGQLFWDNDTNDKIMLAELCKKVKDRPNFKDYKFPDEIVNMLV